MWIRPQSLIQVCATHHFFKLLGEQGEDIIPGGDPMDRKSWRISASSGTDELWLRVNHVRDLHSGLLGLTLSTLISFTC